MGELTILRIEMLLYDVYHLIQLTQAATVLACPGVGVSVAFLKDSVALRIHFSCDEKGAIGRKRAEKEAKGCVAGGFRSRIIPEPLQTN